jgi:hypothetical protein
MLACPEDAEDAEPASGQRGALEAGWRTCAEGRASEYLEALRTQQGLANSHSRHALQELSALRKSGCRTLFKVRLKEPLCLLIDLRA